LSLSHSEAEGFVLAGGHSSRMGQEKALIQLAGRPLVGHALEILRAAGLESRIAGARSDLSQFAPLVPDSPQHSGLGPLAGICSALSAATTRFAVFLPVDLPMIPAGLIEYLLHHATVTASALTVVSVAAFTQTFPAVIDRAALPYLESSLHSGDRNTLKAFRSAASALKRPFTALPIELLVQPGQVRHPHGMHPVQWFLNINTPSDLKAAEAFFAATGPVPVK
jgi:molybdenum cofactor guanylyltransferase